MRAKRIPISLITLSTIWSFLTSSRLNINLYSYSSWGDKTIIKEILSKGRGGVGRREGGYDTEFFETEYMSGLGERVMQGISMGAVLLCFTFTPSARNIRASMEALTGSARGTLPINKYD